MMAKIKKEYMNKASCLLLIQMCFINRVRQVSIKAEQSKPEHHTETAGIHLHNVTFCLNILEPEHQVNKKKKKLHSSLFNKINISVFPGGWNKLGKKTLRLNRYIRVSVTRLFLFFFTRCVYVCVCFCKTHTDKIE